MEAEILLPSAQRFAAEKRLTGSNINRLVFTGLYRFAPNVLDALKNHGDKCEITRMTDEEKHLREILARLDLCTASSLDGMTLKELVAA